MAEDIEYLQENVGEDYKYMMLKVPDYKGTRDEGASLVSYLRLGATPQSSDPTVEEGADLFAKARTADNSAPLFINDTRHRTGEPNEIPQETRQATSAKIISDCGWRDHSDGNRITTTRGDKVEVIRGNYKLLVLGHQDDAEQGAFFDMSGGLIQSGDIAPGATSSVRWVQDPDLGGTWAVLEEAEKGHVTNIYHGRMREEFYGPAITTVIGSADQGQLVLEAGSAPRPNKTNPAISETVYATTITSSTTANSTSEQRVLGSAANYVRVGTMAEDSGDFGPNETASEGTKLEITHADTVDTRILAGTIKNTLGRAGTQTAIQNESFGTADEHWYGNFAELFVGSMESLRIAGFTTEVSVAPMALEAFIGKSMQLFVGASTEINLSRKVEISACDAREFKPGGGTTLAAFIKKNAAAIFLG